MSLIHIWAAERDITIHWDLEPQVTLLGDETLFMRCLLNLLDNAICYGKAGGNVWVSLERQGDHVRLRVRDDGIGIAADQLEHIWERCYQVDPARSSENGNSGLGLSMVLSLIHISGVIAWRSEICRSRSPQVSRGNSCFSAPIRDNKLHFIYCFFAMTA